MSTCIHRHFRRPRVLLPVIHLPYGEAGAMRAIDIAVEAGCPGIFLINQGMNAKEVRLLAMNLRGYPKDLWVGLNLLGQDPDDIIRDASPFPSFMGVWTDHCGVDDQDFGAEPSRLPPPWMENKRWIEEARETSGWKGIYFGGTAFKTQTQITDPSILRQVAQEAATFVDVVTTSGVGTGVAADVAKIRIMKEAIGDHPLGLASGVTPDNIQDYLPYVDAYLVASGIEKSFGVLDPIKTRDLAQAIHGQR